MTDRETRLFGLSTYWKRSYTTRLRWHRVVQTTNGTGRSDMRELNNARAILVNFSSFLSWKGRWIKLLTSSTVQYNPNKQKLIPSNICDHTCGFCLYESSTSSNLISPHLIKTWTLWCYSGVWCELLFSALSPYQRTPNNILPDVSWAYEFHSFQRRTRQRRVATKLRSDVKTRKKSIVSADCTSGKQC